MVIRVLIILLLAISCTPKPKVADGTVVSFLDGNVGDLDPINATNRYNSMITGNIFEGLYHFHYFKRPLTLEPALAEGMPTISKDGRKYRIAIKKDVFFQDDPAFPNGKGREVVAEDFIYAWKRLADPNNRATGWWVLDGQIEGLNRWRDEMRSGKANYDTPISGLKAIDSHTLQITLTKRSFQFSHFLAMPNLVVVAKEVVNKYGKEIGSHPVGTGAFALEKWTRGSEIHLVKNKTFRQVKFPSVAPKVDRDRGALADAGKSLPLADKVVVKIMTERQPLWLSFLKGELDHGIVPKENMEQAFKDGAYRQSLFDKGISFHSLKRPDVVYIGFNMEDPVLGTNKKLRQALAYGFNKQLNIDKFYGGRGVVAQGPVPPNLSGYDPEYKNPIVFDLDKAKKLLADAGYPDGKGLPVIDHELAGTDPWSRQYAEFIKDMWGKIGVKIRIIPNTFPQFDKKLKNKKAMTYQMAWNADYPDGENFLQLFYSKNISPGPNNSNFINRDFDLLFEESLKLPAGEPRNKLFAKMIAIVNDEVPAIFTVHRVFTLPYHGWLKNYNEFPVIYDYYKYLRVDTKEKAKLLQKL